MFGFFKKALKKTLGKITKEVEAESTTEKPEQTFDDVDKLVPETKYVPIKEVEEELEKEETKEILDEQPVKEEKIEPVVKEKKGLFSKLFKKPETVKEEIEEDLNKEVKEELEEVEAEAELPEEKPSPTQSKPSDELPIQELKVKEEIEREEREAELDKEDKRLREEKEKARLAAIEEKKKKQKEPVVVEKKGLFSKVSDVFTKVNLSDQRFEELFYDLEIVMLENNVAVEVIEKIKFDLKKELTTGKVSRVGVEKMIINTLRTSIEELFDVDGIDLLKQAHLKKKDNKPYIITMIGVNGSGKTTTMAKLVHYFQHNGFSCVMAASDTFRAAAIHQLEEHANKLGVKLIKHDYNADPSAVAFDAVAHAKAQNIDVVLIDTAGRMHSNTNLLEELKKLVRVNKPDMKIFVGESITGNDCVEQAKEFDKSVGIDAIILSKADVDDKGGAAISVSYVTKKPILYLGNGQNYSSLTPFDSNLILESLGLA